MLHRLILKVTKFQLPTPKHFSTVVKNFFGGASWPPSCQIALTASIKAILLAFGIFWRAGNHGKMSTKLSQTSFSGIKLDDTTEGGLTIFWEHFTMIPCEPKHLKLQYHHYLKHLGLKLKLRAFLKIEEAIL